MIIVTKNFVLQQPKLIFLQEPFDDFVGIFLGGYRVFFQWISNENQVLQTGKLSQVFKLPPLSDILTKYKFSLIDVIFQSICLHCVTCIRPSIFVSFVWVLNDRFDCKKSKVVPGFRQLLQCPFKAKIRLEF